MIGLQHIRMEPNAFKVCESEMMIVRDLFVESYADFPFYDEIILQPQI